MSKYSTVIDARGTQGNVFAIIGAAHRHLRQLEGKEAADRLRDECFSAQGGYEEALAKVREFFPVHT